MTLFLKQSTAVVISFGPALDKTDGVTEETGLVSALDHATTGIKLSKNGGALTIRHATVTATTYDAYGMYRVTLDTTDTNTLGTLRMAFNEAATCLPVWQDFMVLPANIYDSIVSGSDLIDVSMTQILGTAVSSPATAGILDVNVKNIDNDAASASGTVTFPNATLASTTNITAAAGCAVSSIGANVITAASIAADAITDAKVASDVTIASVTGAVGSVTGAVGSVTGAVGSVTGNVGGNVTGSVGSVVGHTAQTGDAYARLGAPAGASVSADIAAVKAETAATAIENAVWNADPSNHDFAALGIFMGNGPSTSIYAEVADAYARLGAPAGASVSADIAAIKAETATIQAKTTNLPAAPASTTNITAASGVTLAATTGLGNQTANITGNLSGSVGSVTGAVGSVTGAVGSVTGNVGGNVVGSVASVTGLTASDVGAIKAKTDNLPATPADEATLTAMKGATFAGATDSLEAIRDRGDAAWATATGFSTLDAAGVRTAVGLASANLDTQLTAIDDLIDTEVGAIKAKTDYLPSATAGAAGGLFIAGANAATSITGALTANITGSMSGNVEGNVNGSVGSVVGNVGGNVTGSVGSVVGFTPSNIADIISTLGSPNGASVSVDIAAVKNDTALMKGATFDTATDSLEAIRDRGDAAWDTATGFSTLDAAGVRTAVGLASANLDTQLTAIDDLVDTEVAAIYTRLGAPAGASIAADIAGITAGSGLDAAGVRAAIGLATANLDTQLAAIDDLVDTEVAAIKAKTDYLPSATAGAAGGLFIAGANAATTVDITGNITGNLSGTVGSVTGAVGSVTGAVGSVTGAVGSVAANGITDTSIATDAINAAAVKADAVTKIQNGLATPTNITAAAGIALSAGERTTLANAILDLADGATTNYTLREALEVMLAVLAGKLSGAATATITIRDVNDTKNVVVATTDASGNRTAVTVTP